MTDATTVLRDPEWLAHRYDAVADRIQFVRAERALHRAATFLTDEYLPGAKQPVVIARATAIAGAAPPGPVHFLFHSAFCCSTLLVRALDREGVAMGFSEPQILNDIVGWRHRAAVEGPKVAMVLDHSLRLLARPFTPGEAVVLKPSNLLNGLTTAMLGLRPEARALLLHAPLDDFLGSIARKGLWGRLWVRDLLVKLGREGLIDFGIRGDDLLKLTDIQVAALCWLGQHRLFAQLATRFGSRVRTLDSEQLMARPAEAIAALARLYGLALSPETITEIVEGPAFTRNSKTGSAFSAADRTAERDAGLKAHADEVGKVAIWARELARTNGVTLELPSPLLG
jgi:hypothetical protein